MSKISVFNPRNMLRHGASQIFPAAAAGDVTILRAGSIIRGGRTMIRGEHGNSTSAYGGDTASRVYKLVELTSEEIDQLQAELDEQTGWIDQQQRKTLSNC